jgi:hypothetical protein
MISEEMGINTSINIILRRYERYDLMEMGWSA